MRSETDDVPGSAAGRADVPEDVPVDAAEAARELAVIRHLMERPVKYTTQSGLAALLAAVFSLLGLLLDRHFSRHYGRTEAMWINLAVWAGVFLASLVSVTVLTRLRERKRGMPFWSAAKRRILLAILPPFVAAVGLTSAVVCRWYAGVGPNQWGLIPAIWMTFYGVACWQVGEFSIGELRWMGSAFLLWAILAALFLQLQPYLVLGIGFGGFHLVYGLIVLLRHGG